MLRLFTLGQVDLRDAAGSEVRAVLVQPKRLALLVYLAASHTGGFHRRDELLPLLWPELPEDRARNALRQAVHQLRRALEDDVIVSRGGDALGVDRSRVWCDAHEFESALDRGALAEALGAYGGDFLPAFSVPDTQFDGWVEPERMRLRNRAARAAWALAEQHERTGEPAHAADMAHRAASLAGDDEGTVRHLVALLDRVGDPSGAVRTYERFAKRLKDELDLEPAPETTALVDGVRRRNQHRESSPASVSPDDRRAPAGPPGRARVVVSSFENASGDATLDFIGRIAGNTVAQGLAETRIVDVATRDGPQGSDHNGAGENADIEISGSYFLAGDACCFRVGVRLARDGSTLGSVGDVRAPRERAWEAADEISRRVAGIVVGHADPRLASWANAVVEPTSHEAYRHHVLGLERHLRGEYDAAIPHFLRAAEADGGFTMPLLWAIQASCNLAEYEQAEALLGSLRAKPIRLSPLEQVAADYFTASLAGDRSGALRLARQAADLVPQSEVLSQLGREAIFLNHPRAAVDALERLDAERGWTPGWPPYWRRLTEAYHMLGDHGRELVAARRGRQQHPEAVSTLLYEARAHVALGDLAAADACVDQALTLPADRFMDAGEVLRATGAELRAHGHHAASRAMLERAVAWARERESDDGACDPRRRYALFRALYEAAHWDEARTLIDELESQEPANVDYAGGAGAVAARQGDAPRSREALDRLSTTRRRFLFGAHLAWAARISALLGDRDGALGFLRGALARGYCHGVELHTDFDFESLWGYPGFQQLLRPKG